MIPNDMHSVIGLNSELSKLGIKQLGDVLFDVSRAEVIEEAVRNGEGRFLPAGLLSWIPPPTPAGLPTTKYLVHNGDPDLWFASGTQAIDMKQYQSLKAKVLAYLENRKLYVRDITAGADPAQKARLRVITDLAWQNLAAAGMFIPAKEPVPFIDPDLTIIVANGFAERSGGGRTALTKTLLL